MIAGLFFILEEHWPSITARYYQIELLELPWTKILDLVYGWCREKIELEENWEKFKAWLETPPPGARKRVSEVESEQEGQAFMTVMQMTGGA